MPGIIRDPIHNNAIKLTEDPVALEKKSKFKDYGILEGDDGHLLLYIKDETSWPLIAGTEVEYEVETITFTGSDGVQLNIDIAIITREIPSPYVSLINEKVRTDIQKPAEKERHYTKRLDKNEIKNKKIKD